MLLGLCGADEEASSDAKSSCEPDDTCRSGAVKEMAGAELNVRDPESGAISSVCDAAKTSGSAGSVLLGIGISAVPANVMNERPVPPKEMTSKPVSWFCGLTVIVDESMRSTGETRKEV